MRYLLLWQPTRLEREEGRQQYVQKSKGTGGLLDSRSRGSHSARQLDPGIQDHKEVPRIAHDQHHDEHDTMEVDGSRWVRTCVRHAGLPLRT
jgi:hypothetical protein